MGYYDKLVNMFDVRIFCAKEWRGWYVGLTIDVNKSFFQLLTFIEINILFGRDRHFY